ncbi:DUF2339 domain-containing protein [Marinicella rhabdoformis]|uniref:DUF2339 domain-containing protein n=1 Tax=Marinicella rhabdoformis TaxID=2580566 RepID=UPI0012AEDA29|nr:DUF2339 domain-containing protein [Marinicella rhabdoformis]
MRYVFGFIAGIIFGAFIGREWGAYLGIFLGLFWAWVVGLSKKITSLETRIADFEAKEQVARSQARFETDTPRRNVQDAKADGTMADESKADASKAGQSQRPLPHVTPDKTESNPDEYTSAHKDAMAAHDKKQPEDLVYAAVETPQLNDEVAVQAEGKDEAKNEALDQAADELLATCETNNELAVEYTHDVPVATDSAYNEHTANNDVVAASSEHAAERLEAENSATEEQALQKPSAFEQAVSKALSKTKDWIVGYFTGGNSLVRTGMLVLFVGVAFLLKYVAERTVVPVEFRYVGILLGALVLLVLGWRLRKKRPGFALSLQGGGIGVLYLTLFAAMRLHQLIPANMVLILLVGIVVFSAALAVLQDAMALAVIGILGGFAAPILTSTGSGSHVQLFAYYLLLNLSIFGIAWFKSWRLLNVVGFVSTFAVGSVWGAKFYQPQFFASVEPFLIAHFLLYVAVAVLFAFKQPPKLKGINDGTIIFGTPIVVFSLQAALVKDIEYGLAYSALALGVFYVLVAYLVKMLHRPFFKDLIESFIALGVGFGTLAIPLGFDGRVTSAMWVAEASAMVWVGIKQSRVLPRFSGYALAVLGAMAFFVEPEVNKEVMAFMNADFIGVVIIVLASAFIGLYARIHADRLLKFETPWVSHLMLLAAVSWWVIGGLHEIDKHFRASAYFLQQLWLLVTTLVLVFSAKKLSHELLMRCALVVNVAMWPLLANVNRYTVEKTMFLNERFAGLAIVAVFYIIMSVFWAKHFAQQHETKTKLQQPWVSRYFLATGVVTWLFAMVYEIHRFLPDVQLLWIENMMALTAGVLLWFGHKKQWPDFKWAALGVVFAMAMPLYLTFVTLQWDIPVQLNDWPIFNVAYLAMLTYALTHFVVARYWQLKMKDASDMSNIISAVLLLLSLAAWFINGVREAQYFLEAPHVLPAVVIFVSASWLLFVLLAHRMNWSDLHKIKYAITPVLAYLVVMVPNFQPYHASVGVLAWLMAFAVNYWALKVYDGKLGKATDPFHVISLLSLSLVLMFEWAQLIEWQIGVDNIWHDSAAVTMMLVILATVYVLRDRIQWPLKAQPHAYLYWALPLMMCLQWLMLLALNVSKPGESIGIPYLPVLNAIDLVGVATLFLTYLMQKSDPQKSGMTFFIQDQRIRYGLFAVMGFVMLNASMLRCFHYWYGINYQWNDLVSSFMVQTGFSILWAATAVTLMVLAARKKWRPVWLLGLGLMIAVVAKLFLVDMSASGSIERIVAFLTVGVLLSVVGYFSPLPPETKAEHEAKHEAEHEAEHTKEEGA